MSGLFASQSVVPCRVELEQSFDSLHAHALPEGIDIGPGDSVLIHDAPSGIAYGESATYDCQATVTRAGWLMRNWTQLTALLELAELYHVGFEPREAA